MRKLIIVGASGHGKVIADIANKCGYDDIAFLDDNPSVHECGGYLVLGSSSMIEELDAVFVVGIGSASIRQRIQARIENAKKEIATLIHPNAVIGENVSINKGTVVMAGAVINTGAEIGKGCIVNTCASVDHDCKLGDYVHISVGANLAGTVEVGERTWIGIGASVSNNLRITKDCMIGAGAVVIRNIDESGIYVGVPANKIK